MAWAKHAMCLTSLLRAREDAMTKSKAHLASKAAHVSDDDLDAPLSDVALKSIWDNFRQANGAFDLSEELVERVRAMWINHSWIFDPYFDAAEIAESRTTEMLRLERYDAVEKSPRIRGTAR